MVTDGLKKIQPPVCGGNFYKNIDKIFLVRECRGMRKVFLLFMGMLSCGAFMCAGDGLWILGNLYSVCHGKPEFWSEVLEDTKDFVEEALKESADTGSKIGVKLDGDDLGAISAFLHNRGSLEWFLASDCFVKEKHVPLLLNLFRLAYKKTAVGFDASIAESEGYAYVFSENDIDILKLCGMESNIKASGVILRNKILLYDKEEY